MNSELTMSRTRAALASAGLTLLIAGIPTAGITLALVYQNPWWLWLILPLVTLMEGGLFLIAVILFAVGRILGV